MNKYIYIISVLIIFTILSIISSVADKKKIDYVANEYKNLQEEKTSLLKEIKDLKEENNAFRSVIDTYNIPNNLDTRFEVE
ncbi:unknown [Clostridium sp. CAG:465]|jgi:formiminotetrahydrofolate cyclodeaminase|uniref:Cell division protein n=1 Tax=Myoviridae sp. ctXho31 TaxID=2825122 RepID=A0A8S5TWV3_9CAUD|nr:unknown [Clostridium sp. CAG:465]DAF86664.1 MAG TPA: cell division protein [Myoviridae sp. ctXho31]DAM73458.1 MAG TPA: cell division protein [Caudoviricetes sp.]